MGSWTLVKLKYEQLSLYCLVAEKLGNNTAYHHMSALSENNTCYIKSSPKCIL